MAMVQLRSPQVFNSLTIKTFMKIYKYLHSCLVLEENGKRLLIDPGAFSFLEGLLKPEDIGPVDAILLTHQHLDHYYPDALKIILGLRAARLFRGNPWRFSWVRYF